MSTITEAKHRVPRVLTTKQVDDVFAELIRVGDLHVYHAGLLAVDCGLRRMDILTARWENFDFDKGVITLYGSAARCPRFVYMTDRVRRELRGRCPAAGREAYVFMPDRSRGGAGQRLASGLRKVATGLDVKINLRLLRWKFASDFVCAGGDCWAAMAALGLRQWSSADSMLAYCHAIDRARDRSGLLTGATPAPEKF